MDDKGDMGSTSVVTANESVKTEGVKRFDACALYAALDAQRQSRGMSWRQVALEIGVSASTLTRTKQGGRMEVDGMLAMVRWLGRPAESFVHPVGRRVQTRV